jgi:hypothetical protein
MLGATSSQAAPLAFLWLVLGYLQQGEELRLSTEALRLQAEELKNSVEQQRALVEVSRLQVESEREALQQERLLRDEEARPVITAETSGYAFRGDGHSSYRIGLSNVGNIATAFAVHFKRADGSSQRLYSSPIFDKGQHQAVQIEVDKPSLVENTSLQVQFLDKLSRSYRIEYSIARESDHPHSGLVLRRVEA